MNIVITGANRGIGRAIAQVLAEGGHSLVLACRDMSAGEKTAAALSEVATGSIAVLPLELTLKSSIMHFGKALSKVPFIEHHGIDLFINNAGIYHLPPRQVPGAVDVSMLVNFVGPLFLTHVCVPLMAVGCKVMNMSSIAAFVGHLKEADLIFPKVQSYFIAYARAKLAVILGTLDLAEKLAPKVSVNAIHPGLVDTDILRTKNPFDPLIHLLSKPLLITPEQSAHIFVDVVLDPALDHISGAFFSKSKPRKLPGWIARHELRSAIYCRIEKLADLLY